MSFAIFSADCPIDSPVVGSAMAGVIGMKSLARTFAKACRRWPSVLALLAATSASLNPRECRMGTFDSDSAPPAIAMSACPSTIWSAASVIAWLAEAHARLTLHACTDLGITGISATSRAMLGASTDGMTLPYTSRSMLAASRLVRWMSSPTAILPRSIALSDLSVVPARANGVRTPSMIATRRPFP